MKLSNHNDIEFSSPCDEDTVEGRRLIPDSDLDKALLLHVIRQAVESMGKWRSIDGYHAMCINIPVDAEVAGDGTLTAYLVAQPTVFDPATSVPTSYGEDVALHVVQHPSGRIDVICVSGEDSSYVAPNCRIVRSYD
jgi:hypothetical protein